MKITGKIGKIYPQRTGTSRRTGNPFTVTEFHVVWYEENNRGTLTHIQKCSTMQEVDLAKMEKARETLEDLTFNLFLTSSMRHPNQKSLLEGSKSGLIARCFSVRKSVLVK